MTKLRVLLFAFLFVATLSWSQEKEKKNYFENGQPIGVVYTNYHTGVGEGNNAAAFAIKRVYLGYKFDLGDNFSTEIKLDIGSPNDASDFTLNRRFAYFKSAYLQYKKGKITVQFGVIPTRQFKAQKAIWGHRYIRKTVMNLNRMGSSADIGTYIIYDVNKYISFDFGLMNGEGYAKEQNDNSFKVAFATTIKPWKGLQLRFYGDVVDKGEKQINWVNFISYNWNNKIIAGFEYNTQYNVKNVAEEDLTAWSAFLTYNFIEKWQVFGRYDLVQSNTLESDDDPWRFNKDGSFTIVGLQYQVHKKVKLALDYQSFTYRDTSLGSEDFVFLNVEFKI